MWHLNFIKCTIFSSIEVYENTENITGSTEATELLDQRAVDKDMHKGDSLESNDNKPISDVSPLSQVAGYAYH